MVEAIQVCTTVAEKADAERISAALVAKHLAACVQITGPIESTFRWRGSVEASQEWICTAKTLREAYPQVEHAIRQIHSYDEPEIIAIPIIAASTGYLQWIAESVKLAVPTDE
jgi:periplasmic divalent cation tolerance protein